MKTNVVQIRRPRDWLKEERAPTSAPTVIVTRRKVLPAKYFSIQETAARLSVSVQMLYECINRGQLKAQKIRSILRIAEEDLLDFLEAENLRRG